MSLKYEKCKDLRLQNIRHDVNGIKKVNNGRMKKRIDSCLKLLG